MAINPGKVAVGDGRTAHKLYGQATIVYTNSTHLKRVQTRKVYLSAFSIIVSQINIFFGFFEVYAAGRNR